MQIRLAEGCDKGLQRQGRQRYKEDRMVGLGEHLDVRREVKDLE